MTCGAGWVGSAPGVRHILLRRSVHMGITLGIIGAGNMGMAILRGGIEAGVLSAQAIVVADVEPDRRDEAARLGCQTTADVADLRDARQLILAVKPQGFGDVAQTLGRLKSPTVVISIMAGLGSREIRAALGPSARVVRVMPNTPCQVGAGMAAIAMGEGAEPGDETLAVGIFEALGRTVIVDEALMHAVTAVSGSGPAYVFLLAEAMEQAGVGLGLDRNTARLLVRQTIFGAGKLLAESGRTPSELRAAVTSPGGTTEAALREMDRRELPEIVRTAVIAARDRGVELSSEDPN